ncbi:hypothetical protein [Klenkia sp. PcliD-1-E]|uniref:hypothetical protein n=1 Tax=Klenkia sp. PcliD-1-E TaxID=2954492 RepID=UPI002097F7AD|nr:hypothetical protein [Klenkia sp. PcliD-1-E]MCO7222330.1 hypothetical protein [Klenkia sp. PcliD-1-E]
MTAMRLPALSPTARGLLGTLAEIGRPVSAKGLLLRCNPRPVTTTEAEVDRWRGREHDLRRAVAELHETGMVAHSVQKQGSEVVQVVWIP